MSGEPVTVETVATFAIDALLGGSFGWFSIPRGGVLKVDHLPRKNCYRVTIDLSPGGTINHVDGLAFNAETWRRLADLVAGTAVPPGVAAE